MAHRFLWDHQRWLRAGVFLAALLFASEALVSKVHYEDQTLDEVVADSDLIIIAKPKSERVELIDITPSGQGRSDRAPPFQLTRMRFDVVRVVGGKGHPPPEKMLEALPRDWQRSLELHRMYYVDGVSKSYATTRYVPSSPFALAFPSDREVVLFLRRDSDGWTLLGADTLDVLPRIRRTGEMARDKRDAPSFFDVDVTFEGQKLEATRTPELGIEIPLRDRPRGAQQGAYNPGVKIPLSPFPIRSPKHFGRTQHSVTLAPARAGRAGTLRIKLRVTTGEEPLLHWLDNSKVIFEWWSGDLEATRQEWSRRIGTERPRFPVPFVLAPAPLDARVAAAVSDFVGGSRGSERRAALLGKLPKGSMIETLRESEVVEFSFAFAAGEPPRSLVLTSANWEVRMEPF